LYFNVKKKNILSHPEPMRLAIVHTLKEAKKKGYRLIEIQLLGNTTFGKLNLPVNCFSLYNPIS
uniref:hypothetical protein n=1 Tax=Bartonella queenslandensis TaxID=481138 RepID=UPI001AEBC6E5